MIYIIAGSAVLLAFMALILALIVWCDLIEQECENLHHLIDGLERREGLRLDAVAEAIKREHVE